MFTFNQLREVACDFQDVPCFVTNPPRRFLDQCHVLCHLLRIIVLLPCRDSNVHIALYKWYSPIRIIRPSSHYRKTGWSSMTKHFFSMCYDLSLLDHDLSRVRLIVSMNLLVPPLSRSYCLDPTLSIIALISWIAFLVAPENRSFSNNLNKDWFDSRFVAWYTWNMACTRKFIFLVC